MSLEETAVVAEQEPEIEQTPAPVEESAATTEQTAPTPVESEPSGEAQTPVDETEVKPETDGKPRSAEKRIRGLVADNTQLRERLQTMLSQPQQAPPPPPVQPGDVLAQQYNQALAEFDRLTNEGASQEQQRAAWSRARQVERQIDVRTATEQAQSAIFGLMQRQQVAARVSQEYVRLNGMVPFLKDDLSFDPESPVTQVGIRLARERGITQFDPLNHVDVLKDAVLEVLANGSARATSKLKQVQNNAQKLAARTGAETSSRSLPRATGSRLEQLLKKQQSGQITDKETDELIDLKIQRMAA